MDSLYGFQVFPCHYMFDRKQVKFPRSKKKRMIKKWRKQPKNYKIIPQEKVIQIGNGLHMHPDLYIKLKEQTK
jgi:hypothetical protein